MGNTREKSQSMFFHPTSKTVDVNVQRKVNVWYFVLKISQSFHAQFMYSLFDYILGLFGIRDVLINTDYIIEDHIEAAKVYIQTLADSAKLSRKTVVHMTGIAGETCTADMLQAIIAKKWLHDGVSITTNI